MYLIEGNIGVGKSTLCELLKDALPQYQVITEPVQSWHSDNEGESLLQHFYTNPHRWGYTMETLTLINRLKEYLFHSQQTEKTQIFERSLYSGFYCFALNGKNKGFLNAIEWDIYSEWTKFLIQQTDIKPSGFIYLRASPHTCYTRIQKRSRTGENNIPLEYLHDIHLLHELFLVEKSIDTSLIKNVPVLVLDAEADFTNSSSLRKSYIEKIDHFITEQNAQKKI